MLITTVGAAKAFGARSVLTNVNAEFPSGKVSALVGPSGAGKTTLLMAITGDLPLSDGRVWWSDGPGQETPPDPTLVAWVTQTPSLLAHRTTLDNVALGALAHGQERAEARDHAQSLLEAFDLRHVASYRAGTLSGGERQRVSVCRALATRRPVIVADEPSANLDAANTAIVMDTFRRLAGAGVTVVVASHDPAVLTVVEHVVTLR